MAKYCPFHHTTIGYSHIKKNTCCEDASISLSVDGINVIVVSDGHGDPACFRSQIGSKLAVEIAAEKLVSFAKNIQDQGWEDQLLNPAQQEKLLRQLIRSIIGNWNLQIATQLEAEPITEEEFAVSRSYEAAYRAGRDLPHIFGCTLIAALVTDRYLLALQQGDGRCVVVHGDGTTDQPIPWDDRCVGNVCTSLCHEDAVYSCRYYVQDLRQDPLIACFAVSDGIEDSLESQEDVNAFVCNIASILLQDGRDELLTQLEDYLPHMSQVGSADDMSIAGIVAEESTEAVTRWLELQYILSSHKATLRSAHGKIKSMQRKHDFLEQEVRQAQDEYMRIHQKLTEDNTLIDRLTRELRRIIKHRDEHTLTMDVAKERLESAKNQFEEYSQLRQTYIDKARAAEDDIRKTQLEIDDLSKELPEISRQSDQEIADWELLDPIIWDEAEETEPSEIDPAPEGFFKRKHKR